MSFKSWVCGVLVATAVFGCGSSGPDLVPVEGTVTLDGKPFPNKSLMFTPIDGTAGNGAGGFSNADGAYTLKAVVPGATRDYSGIPPGRYRVTVYESGVATETPGEVEGDEPAVAIAPGLVDGKSDIPAVYGSEQSPLVVEVPESGGVVDVDLKSNSGI